MTEIESLQQRVDAIQATGNADLAGRAYLALSEVLRAFTRKKRNVERFPIERRVTAQDVEWLLQDLAGAAAKRRMNQREKNRGH